MAKSNTVSFTVPDDIKLKLETITHINHYDSLSEFLRDAIRSHFFQNKDLGISVAHYLNKEKKIGLGKAAEIIGESISERLSIYFTPNKSTIFDS